MRSLSTDDRLGFCGRPFSRWTEFLDFFSEMDGFRGKLLQIGDRIPDEKMFSGKSKQAERVRLAYDTLIRTDFTDSIT